MKHVDERIRERALPAAADRAFAALRDREALAAFVREKAPGQGSADEVALALAPGDDPPRLLVSRQGRGVTCLASGMATPSAVVPYGEVQAFVDEQQRLLRARMVIAQDEQRLENQRPLTRALELAYRLTRSEHDALRALSPLVGDGLVGRLMAHIDRLNALRAKVKRWPVKSDADAGQLWREHTAACIQLLALVDDPRVVRLAFASLSTGDAQLSVRALWILANRPGVTLGELSALLDEGKPPVAGVGSLLGVIASRFPEERSRAAALAARVTARTGEPGLDAARDVDDAPFALLFLSLLPLLLLRYPPREMRTAEGAAAFKQRLEDAQEALMRGASLAEAARAAGGWVERVTTLLDPYRHLQSVQAVRDAAGGRSGPSPRAARAVPGAVSPADVQAEKEARVRLILWRALLRDLRMPALALPVEVLAFLTAAPVDAVLPPERPDPVWRLRAGRQYVRDLLPAILAQASR